MSASNVLNPYGWSVEESQKFQLARSLWDLLIDKRNGESVLDENELSKFMFGVGVLPSKLPTPITFDASGKPVLSFGMRTRVYWRDLLKVSIALEETYARACEEWLSCSAGRDLGEFFYEKGLDVSGGLGPR